MMDHARHLSSPSPTSPFFFHHSERLYKSNPLTPLLSSAADVTSVVDDCFSSATSSTHHLQSNPFGLDHHHHHHHSLVDNHHHHHNHHQPHSSSQRNNIDQQCVNIAQDSLTGVDDDDAMHNMLSGSSTSSNSTMPLLTENHSHHSFSRISLDEYSPLSLVEDCDNALPISPTSLACGSHHSFKSSLNGLKMDNLVDVDEHHHHHHHHHNDDVNDARSMSPSLLSGSTANHHNLWSNSSTAISQNTSLLNGTSTSFLLSQYHHNQLNSLMQQLEPQSLDEPPPLMSNGLTLNMNPTTSHRPSSEPPPGLESQDIDHIKSPSSSSGQLSQLPSGNSSKQTGAKQTSSRSGRSAAVSSATSSPASNRSRKSKSRSSTSNKQASLTGKTQHEQKPTGLQQPAISSKVHFQLNHRKKLQELQQRLFGVTNLNGLDGKNDTVDDNHNNLPTATCDKQQTNSDSVAQVREEPDSSMTKEDATTPTTTSSNAKVTVQSTGTSTAIAKTRTRPPRTRKSRAKQANEISGKSTDAKVVTTETAEPDTTTKTSDCIKLADLLASSSNSDQKIGGNIGFIVNGLTTSESGDVVVGVSGENGEKRMQQIQLQVSPSLTVVSNGNLMQPVSIQHQHQQQAIITSNGSAAFANQILCRPQAFNGQKATATINGEAMIVSNWSPQASITNTQSTCAATTTTTTTASTNNSSSGGQQQQAIGTHQIAIQVICQDGTSLVLPVSTAAGLNAAVSLTTQHQQLQAVLANNSQQQRQSGAGTSNGQMLPMMSVSNIVAHQANNSGSGNENGASTPNCAAQTTTSGLAASSPTLAALLDAGSNRANQSAISLNGSLSANNNSSASSELLNVAQLTTSNQNFVSTNLLRKLVSGNVADLKQGTNTTLGLTNCGSIVTVCTAPNSNNQQQQAKSSIIATSNSSGEKRIKLENADTSGSINGSAATPNLQATFTLIDPQGLIVANGNEKSSAPSKQQQQTIKTTTTPTTTTTSNSNGVQASAMKTSPENTKPAKMGSTGNRQVDPAQPFRCEHCNSTFTRLGNFTRHKKIHTVPTKDGQRFKCDVCSKSFLQRCDLARHLHIHRGTEPHRCNICGKGYIRHSDLVTHQRFHNKEKPFGCPHCSKGFCQRGDLNRHLRSIHLQMKPILCPCCNRKFAKQETLLRHLNTAHRSKPGGLNSTNSVTIAGNELQAASNQFAIAKVDDKQNAVSVVTTSTANGGLVLSNSTNGVVQKNGQVASLQAIQATLCQVQQQHQSADPSTNQGTKAQPTASPNSVTETEVVAIKIDDDDDDATATKVKT